MRGSRSWIEEQEARGAELVAALSASGEPGAVDLAGKLSRCAEHRARLRAWGRVDHRHVLSAEGRYRCASHACWSCSRRRRRQIGEKAGEQFRDADSRWCSHVTVGLAVTGDLSVVREAVTVARRALRDRRDAASRVSPAWCAVACIGHVEVDAILPDDVPSLAPERRALVEGLPVLAHPVEGAPLWIVHLHVAMRHEGVGREEVGAVLSRQWPGVQRVHVMPFDEGQLPAEAAGAVAAYSAKGREASRIGDVVDEWPVAWRAAYWSWLHAAGRALQPLRVTLGAKAPVVSAPSRVAALLAGIVCAPRGASAPRVTSRVDCCAGAGPACTPHGTASLTGVVEDEDEHEVEDDDEGGGALPMIVGFSDFMTRY